MLRVRHGRAAPRLAPARICSKRWQVSSPGRSSRHGNVRNRHWMGICQEREPVGAGDARNANRPARATPGTRTGTRTSGEWAMAPCACLSRRREATAAWPPAAWSGAGERSSESGRARAVARDRQLGRRASLARRGGECKSRSASGRARHPPEDRRAWRSPQGGTARGCVPSVDDGSSRRGEHGARMLSGPARGARQLQRGAHGRVRVIVSGAVPDRERVRLRRPECGGLGLGGGIDAGRPIVPRARVVAGSGFVRSRFDRACWQRHDHRHRDGRPRLSSRAQSTRPRVRATAR